MKKESEKQKHDDKTKSLQKQLKSVQNELDKLRDQHGQVSVVFVITERLLKYCKKLNFLLFSKLYRIRHKCCKLPDILNSIPHISNYQTLNLNLK